MTEFLLENSIELTSEAVADVARLQVVAPRVPRILANPATSKSVTALPDWGGRETGKLLTPPLRILLPSPTKFGFSLVKLQSLSFRICVYKERGSQFILGSQLVFERQFVSKMWLSQRKYQQPKPFQNLRFESLYKRR